MAAPAAPQKIGQVDVAKLRQEQGDQILFVVERRMDGSDDPEMVVYRADRQGNILRGICFEWINMNNPSQREEVSEKTRDLFYGVVLHKMDKEEKKDAAKKKKPQYRMKIHCFPDRLVDLHLKNPKKGAAGPGKVTAKAVINGKRCVLDKVWTDISTMPPGLNEMWVCGTFNGETVEERIVITDDMRSKIDVTAFIGQLL